MRDGDDDMAMLSIRICTAIAALVRNRRGNVAMIFGFAIMPLLVAVGSAVDYSQAARSRNHIATSADAAALAATKVAQNYMNTNGTGATAFASASALAQTAMSQTFAANQTSDGYSQNVLATLAMTQAVDGSPIATVTASANAPTFLMRIVGIPTVAVGATSQAKGAGGTYYQIVFVVDVSNSMAIGGTQTDINNLQNDRYIQNTKLDGNNNIVSTPCAFACHDPNAVNTYASSDYCMNSPNDGFCHGNGLAYCPYGNGNCKNVTSGVFSDKRAIAKKYGYKLKIDYVNDAVNTFITQLKPKMDKAPQYYNVAIDTFGTNFTQLQTFTNNSTTLANAAAQIDVEAATPAGNTPSTNKGFTNTATALQSALSNVSNIGDGSSATSRKTFFIFMSDGAEDVWSTANYPYGRSVDVNYLNACNAIKAAGNANNPATQPTIFSIDATYYALPNEAQYQTLISNYNLGPQFPTTMQACATATSQYSTYFSASDGPDIQSAVQQVFSNIFGNGSLHLTR